MKALNTLLDRETGLGVLTNAFRVIYDGNLDFPPPPFERPYIAFNFAKSLDGVISFMIPGKEGGGEISGFNSSDQFVMAMLRSVFGNVMVGANAIRKQPDHLWTPEFLFPDNVQLFSRQRLKFGQSGKQRTFVVTGSGQIKPEHKHDLPPPPEIPAAFQDENTEAWIITTEIGRSQVVADYPFLEERIKVFGDNEKVDLKSTLLFLRQELQIKYLLVEGEARFAGSLIEEGLFDEFFLSTASQIVGSSTKNPRLSFVEGALFTPETAPWFKLISLKLDHSNGDMVLARYRRYK